MNWPLIQNSLAVAGGTMVCATVAGLGSALWLRGLSQPWQRLVLALSVATLVLPPFLQVNCWMRYLGANGIGGGLNLYSVPGVIWVLTLMYWPISLLAALAAWRKLDQGHAEANLELRGAAWARWVLWPAARPALSFAAVLVFVLALNEFSVPAILQVKVFPAELWVAFNTQLKDMHDSRVLAMTVPLVLAPGLIALLWRQRLTPWPGPARPLGPATFRQQLGPIAYILAGIAHCLLLGLALGIPLADLLGHATTWTEFAPAVKAGVDTIVRSVWLAAAAASVAAGLGLVLSSWKFGWTVWLWFFVPGVVLGLIWIWAFNRSMWGSFYPSLAGVIAAFSLRYLGLGWGGAVRALRPLKTGLMDVARLDGLSRWAIWRHVYWPQAGALIAATWYLIYLLCLWDVETLILIVPPGGETVSLRVFNLLHYGHTGQVNALCLVLLGAAIVPGLIGWVSMRRWPWRGLICLTPLFFLGCSPAPSTWSSKLFERVEIIGARGTGPGQFNKPRSVAVDGADRLYVVDMTGRVQQFSPGGQYLNSWQMPETDRGRPKGMCGDPQGGVYVVEPHYARLNRYDVSGHLVAQWAPHGTNQGQLAFPRAVALTPQGNVLISEYGPVERVQEFTPNGDHFLKSFGQFGGANGEFNRPEGLGVDPTGKIYVADSCNHRIQIFSPQGQWLRSFGRAGGGQGELSYPYDVRVDPAGRQYVCEFGNSRVQIFDTKGELIEILGGPGLAPGRFNNPWSLALDSQGNLYVADANNHRVQKFIRAGKEAR